MAKRKASREQAEGECMNGNTANGAQEGNPPSANTTPAVTMKPLMELWDIDPRGPLGLLPHPGATHVDGLPLPHDFDPVIGFHAGECLLFHDNMMETEPWFYWWLSLSYEGDHYDHGRVESDFPRYHFYGPCHKPPPLLDENGQDLSEPEGWGETNLGLSDRQRFAVGVAMRDAMTQGFMLALLRYRDELKGVPEAAALMESVRNRAVKMNEAKRQKRRKCGDKMMTLDERDAAIVAEFPELKRRLGSMEAQQHLADKYGPLTREMVGVIIRKAKRQNAE
jgi:hypothetical protein